MPPRKPRPLFANAWFFPAAAFYAALLLPWSVLIMLGLLPPTAGLNGPAGHAHEMLFGFALAVVAGYLLGPQPLRVTLALLACWLLARLGFVFWPGSWLAAGAATLFAAGLAWKVVPRFAGAAKKWRNRTVAPVVAGLSLLSAVASQGFVGGYTPVLLREGLLLLSVLLFFMGGRILAPALAGHALSQGRTLKARVQPRLEGTVLITLLLALAFNPLPWRSSGPFTGALMIGAGLLTAVRLLRWRPWHCLDRPDLLVLLAGYLWLAVGLLLFGTALLTRWLPLSATLHALTVGALGSLTFGVMARTRLLQNFRDANARPWIHPFAGLISLAALARVLPALLGQDPRGGLLLAAACWTSAFVLLLILLWQTRDGHPQSRRNARQTQARN